ncbi:hypothetical protein NKG05_00990 [Oerskovia sp. M15]
MDLTDPQQWQAYSYANNTPATMSDPTGLLMLADGMSSRPKPASSSNKGASTSASSGTSSGSGKSAGQQYTKTSTVKPPVSTATNKALSGKKNKNEHYIIKEIRQLNQDHPIIAAVLSTDVLIGCIDGNGWNCFQLAAELALTIAAPWAKTAMAGAKVAVTTVDVAIDVSRATERVGGAVRTAAGHAPSPGLRLFLWLTGLGRRSMRWRRG